MKSYIDLVRYLLADGHIKSARNGSTISCFGQTIVHDMNDGFPLLTTKKMHWRSIVHELLWFIRGDRDIQYLKDKGITIWDEWVNGIELDTAYGFFWRNFPSFTCRSNKMCGFPSSIDTEHEEVWTDQLQLVINELKTNPNSRRMLVSAWEPNNAWYSRLPPCHHSWGLYHLNDKVSIMVNMRSVDVGLGLPFNIASYALLLCMICNECSLIPDKVMISMTDCHIYTNHALALREQTKRLPYKLPELMLTPKLPVIETKFEDIELKHYQSHDRIDMEVSP